MYKINRMQTNKQPKKRELLTPKELSRFKPAPMKVFTRNTEHQLTTTDIFELGDVINLISVDYCLPLWVSDIHVISQGNALGKAMGILIHLVKNN